MHISRIMSTLKNWEHQIKKALTSVKIAERTYEMLKDDETRSEDAKNDLHACKLKLEKVDKNFHDVCKKIVKTVDDKQFAELWIHMLDSLETKRYALYLAHYLIEEFKVRFPAGFEKLITKKHPFFEKNIEKYMF